MRRQARSNGSAHRPENKLIRLLLGSVFGLRAYVGSGTVLGCTASGKRRRLVYRYKVIVDRVIDGDTVDVNIWLGFDVVLPGQRIRLHGIDTPESRTRDLTEKFYGLLSKKYLQDLAPVGGALILQSMERGKFGRILGILYQEDDEISINDHMCKDGYAVPYHGGNKAEGKALHLANRERLAARGLTRK